MNKIHSVITLTSPLSHRTLAGSGKELKDNFLRELASREEANRSGKMTSIVFIRDNNQRGQEISGYIDYAHRLKTEDFEPYFSGKKKLLPRPSDLRLVSILEILNVCTVISLIEYSTSLFLLCYFQSSQWHM